MAGPFTAYFEAEHEELGRLLRRSLPRTGEVDLTYFDAFRRRLLQRIAVEERVLFPALEARGARLLYRPGLARDHRGLVAICAPTPHREWVDGLWEQLEFHHAVEMGAEGFCVQCDEFLSPDAAVVLARAATLPTVIVAPFEEGHRVRDRIAELLEQTLVLK